MIQAAAFPFQAVFFNAGIVALFNTEGIDLHKLDEACLCLVLVGLGSGVAVLCQNSLFTYLQESLCLILRKAAFASTIRMDMAFFDAPENQTASILVSLERHMSLGCNRVLTLSGPRPRSRHRFTGGRRGWC